MNNNPSFASRWNIDEIDRQYSLWLISPSNVSTEWQYFFEGFHLGGSSPLPLSPEKNDTGKSQTVSDDSGEKHACLYGAIYAFRDIGHTQGTFDPIADEVVENPRLSLARLGLDQADLNEIHFTGNYLGGVRMSIGEILNRLRKTYCENIGVEYLHLQTTEKRRWIQSKIEPNLNRHSFNHDEKLRILRKIIQAEEFENFLHTRYVGQKRFSLEGGETLITCLDSIFQKCPICSG